MITFFSGKDKGREPPKGLETEDSEKLRSGWGCE